MISCSANNTFISPNKITSHNVEEINKQELLNRLGIDVNSKTGDINNSEYQKFFSQNKNNINSNIDLANAYNARKDKDNAEFYYKKALEIDSNNFSANFYYADFLIKNNRYKESQKYLIKAINVNTNNSAAYGNLGLTYLYDKDFNKAEENLKKALEINGENIDSLYNYGELKLLQENYNEAIPYFEKVFVKSSSYSNVAQKLGICYTALKNDQKSEFYLKTAYELNTNNEKSLILLLDFYQKKGDIVNSDKYSSFLKNLRASNSNQNSKPISLGNVTEINIESNAKEGISCNHKEPNYLKKINLKDLTLAKLKLNDPSFNPDSYTINYYDDIKDNPNYIVFTIQDKFGSDNNNIPKIPITKLSQSFKDVIKDIDKNYGISCNSGHSDKVDLLIREEKFSTIPEEAKISKSKSGSLNCINDDQQYLQSIDILGDKTSSNPFISADVNRNNYDIKYNVDPLVGYLPRLYFVITEKSNTENKLTVSEILWGIRIKLLNDYKVSCTISDSIPVSIYQSEL